MSLIYLSSSSSENDQEMLPKLIPKFVSESMKPGRWTEKGKSENESVFELFMDISDDLPINQYDHQVIRKTQ
jgi:hypothetical protein